MLFAKLRRSVALWVCPELGPDRRSALEVDAGAAARQRWINAERQHLIEEGEKFGHKPSRQDRFLAIRAVMGSGKPFDAGTDGGVSAGRAIADFKDNGDQDRVVNAGLGLEQRDSVVDHSSLLRSVGTDEGTARTEAMKDVSTLPRSDAAAPTSPNPEHPHA